MREGMKRGIVQPKALISSGLAAFKALGGEREIEKSPFWTAIKVMPASFVLAGGKDAITVAHREAIEKRLQPALAKFAEFVERGIPARLHGQIRTRCASRWQGMVCVFGAPFHDHQHDPGNKSTHWV